MSFRKRYRGVAGLVMEVFAGLLFLALLLPRPLPDTLATKNRVPVLSVPTASYAAPRQGVVSSSPDDRARRQYVDTQLQRHGHMLLRLLADHVRTVMGG